MKKTSTTTSHFKIAITLQMIAIIKSKHKKLFLTLLGKKRKTRRKGGEMDFQENTLMTFYH